MLENTEKDQRKLRNFLSVTHTKKRKKTKQPKGQRNFTQITSDNQLLLSSVQYYHLCPFKCEIEMQGTLEKKRK